MQKPTVFFGDKNYATKPVTKPGALSIIDEPFAMLSAMHGFNNLIFPYQVHGIAGLVVESGNFNTIRSFVQDADWIITNVPKVGIGVLTADCVPLLIYDPVHNAVGAVHAGWRGAVEGVVVAAIDGMRSAFGSRAEDVQVFIGPHARTCCYQVDQQMYDTVMQKRYGKSAWRQNDQALFFDLYGCCVEQLKEVGVLQNNITDTGMCTICNTAYCSYRREKAESQRNISLIGLIY